MSMRRAREALQNGLVVCAKQTRFEGITSFEVHISYLKVGFGGEHHLFQACAHFGKREPLVN